MDAVGVLDRDQMAALGAGEPQLGDGGGRVVQQAFSICRIGPRFGDDARAVTRADADRSVPSR
jgi:hypothetical protein